MVNIFRQVAIANEVFSPGEAEVTQARRASATGALATGWFNGGSHSYGKWDHLYL